MTAKTPRKTPAQGAGAGGTQAPAAASFLDELPGGQAPAQQQAPGRGKMQEVERLSELRPGTYWYRRLDSPRGWIVSVMAFDNNTKIRISAITARGLVQVLNLNYDRMADLIEILRKIDEKLPAGLKQQRAKREGGEW